MTTPALQLESIWFEEIFAESNANYVKDQDDGGLSLRTEVSVFSHNEETDKFLVQLRVSPKDIDSRNPFDFALKATGVFSVDEAYLEEAGNLLHITGGSMLYGSCREMLLMITGRMGRRTVKLPAVSPREAFVREAEEPGFSDSQSED